MELKISQHLSITLFFYVAFFVLFVSRADASIHAQPNHRRLLRKRVAQLLDFPITPPGTPSADSTTSTAAVTQVTSTLGSTVVAPTAPVPTTASQVSTSVSSSTSQSTASVSASSPSSTSSSSPTIASISTSGSSSTSSLKLVPSPTDIITSSGVAGSLTTNTLSVTEITSSSSPSPSSSAQTQKAATANSNQKTMTAIIVVASSIGGIAILWTLFRKWKLGRSSKFDERLQPIDWQPTSDDNSNRRPLSVASSFHSGGHGFGTEPHDHGGAVPLPEHDFTALPPSSRLAVVGGYADLARGPSPQPPMQEAYGSHNPVTGGPNYDVNVPLHHQGGYGTRDAYNYAPMRY